ncbi:Proteasome assembly chaperone 2 [Blattella germanica]|nr:Proteasome assembly chaperone 2 [Blattella germanica]
MFYLQEKVNFTNSTLIFPSVSVGNVGQLTTDLLITALKPKKVGLIWHSSIIPLVGGDPYNFNNPNLTTSAEVYFSEERKLIIIQIRSPITKKMSGDFISMLVDWIKKNSISKVFILAGVFEYTRHDNEISGSSLKIVTSQDLTKEFEHVAEGIAAAVVMKFCSEGDNVPDSKLLCNFINQLLKLVPSDAVWEAPPSWINMFGNSPQLGLY